MGLIVVGEIGRIQNDLIGVKSINTIIGVGNGPAFVTCRIPATEVIGVIIVSKACDLNNERISRSSSNIQLVVTYEEIPPRILARVAIVIVYFPVVVLPRAEINSGIRCGART